MLAMTLSRLSLLKWQKGTPKFNPTLQPTLGVQDLPVLQPATLNDAFIRLAFQHTIDWQVEAQFAHSFAEEFAATSNAIPSAVYIGLVKRSRGLSVLFTKRTAHLPTHAGQVCFPGGRLEPSDMSPKDAAVRETFEELGIAPQFIEPLGQHPIFTTTTGFAICPIVGMVHEGYQLKTCINEVAEVFEVPLDVLLNPKHHHLHEVATEHGAHRYFSITWHEHFIWGATAVLVRNLYHFLAAAEQQLSD